MISIPPPCPNGSFLFERDTFSFANELVWQYRFDPTSGKMTVSRNDPPPTYSHRCFVVVRSARQFFCHARFEPTLPAVEPEVYRRLIRQVIKRSPRRSSGAEERIVIPGYEGLRAFSQAHAPLLKAGCGGAWQSYCLRSHWRMVAPVWAWQQEEVARQLQQRMRDGVVPLVHIFRFPRITINHGILLFGMVESEQEIQFEAYDPNITARPVKLIYNRSRRAFSFPPTCYWAGGELSVIEIFCGGLY
jgi:hypothetical protein